MKYIKLFENFSDKEIVTVKGEIGQVIKDEGDKVLIKFFKPLRDELVRRESVKKQVKCLSQCNKRVIGSGNNRMLKCSYCGKEQK